MDVLAAVIFVRAVKSRRDYLDNSRYKLCLIKLPAGRSRQSMSAVHTKLSSKSRCAVSLRLGLKIFNFSLVSSSSDRGKQRLVSAW